MSNTQSGSLRKIIIIAVVALFAIVSGAAAANEFIFKKTPKQLFALSEINTATNTINDLKKEYGADFEFQKAMASTPSKTDFELSGDFDLGDAMSPEEKKISEMLKSSKVAITSSSDPIEQMSNVAVSLILKGSNLLDLEYFQSKDQLGFKAPVINDKYFYVNSNEFGKAAKRIYPEYSGPDKLDLSSFSYKDLNINEKEWSKIGSKYLEVLNSNLPEEYFTLQKGVSYNSPDGEKKLRQLTLEMTSEQTELFLSKFAEELNNDTELQDLLTTSIVEFAKLSVEKGNSQYQAATDPSLTKKQVKSFFEEITKGITDAKFTDGFKMILTIDDDEAIVNRQTIFTLDNTEGTDGAEVNLDTKNWNGKNDKKSSSLDLVIVPTKQKDSNITLNIKSEATKEQEGLKKQFTANAFLSEKGSKSGDITLKFNTLYSPENGDKRKSVSDFELFTSANFNNEIPKISGKFTRTIDQNLSKKYSNQDIGINVSVEFSDGDGTSNKQKADVTLNLKNNSTLIDKVELPAMNAGNSVNLGTVSDSELKTITEQIMTSLEKFAVQNEALLGQLN